MVGGKAMKKNYRKILIVTLLILGLVAGIVSAAIMEQSSSIRGMVLAEGLPTIGQEVKEGQVLLYVNSINGKMPAVRANISGKVVEVLVRPGEDVSPGQVVFKIQSIS